MAERVANPLIESFVASFDDLRQAALGTLLEPEWLEQKLPLAVRAMRVQHPDFSQAQLHAAIFSAGVQKTLQWLDVGEELITLVLENHAQTQN